MKRKQLFQLNVLMGFISVIYVVIPETGSANELVNSGDSITFDPIFLSPWTDKKVNISRFEKGPIIVAGTYSTSIFINGKELGNEKVTFHEDDNGNVSLCLQRVVLQKINLNTRELSPLAAKLIMKKDNACIFLNSILPAASFDYDSEAGQLNLIIPQVYLQSANQDYVSPEYWDEGINAMMLGYQSNFNSFSSDSRSVDSAYVGLNSGLNIKAWKLRHNGNYNWLQGLGGGYQRINTYVERDIPDISGRLIIGENNTSGNIFDSVAYRGVELKDVERMQPQTKRGYAPEVRGIARTNATVTIRQNGHIIHETTVVPGAFNIDDMYPNNYGGDLEVTVTEADGTVQRFTVPYTAVSQLLRPGSQRYDIVIGEFNDTRALNRRAIYQATYQRGLTNMFTGYGGVQSSRNDYYNLQLGTAMNTFAGALAFDVSHARTQSNDFIKKDNSFTGQSYRVTYNKYLSDTKTNLSVATYRYSNSGYLDYQTAMLMIDGIERGRTPDTIYRPKSRITTTFNQSLPSGYGQFYISGYTQDYWNKRTGSELQYQMGHNNNFKSVTYGLNAARNRNGQGDMETTLMFNMSIPLNGLNYSNTPNMTVSLNRDGRGNYGQQVGVSGTAGQEHQYSYGATVSHFKESPSSSSLNGQYLSPFANLNGALSKGQNYNSLSAGASGTLLAYSGGVVATPYTSDTFAIVEAKGASGAVVGNYTGVKVDRFGHAAVPNLNPYETNEITLDPKGISQKIELENTSQKVTPYAGSVVHMKFKTLKGQSLLLKLNKSSIPIPFGAEVINTQGKSVGIVGQGGEVYARVEARSDTLRIQWGDSGNENCTVHYALTDKQINSENIIRLPSTCITRS
ncbi:fimbria/pilus outer membrane usher protein [Enterobacter sp. UPMP2060]